MHRKSSGYKGSRLGSVPVDILGPVGVERGSGDHRFNVFYGSLPGWLCISIASPSRDCSTKQGQGSRVGLCLAPLIPAEG